MSSRYQRPDRKKNYTRIDVYTGDRVLPLVQRAAKQSGRCSGQAWLRHVIFTALAEELGLPYEEVAEGSPPDRSQVVPFGGRFGKNTVRMARGKDGLFAGVAEED